MGKDVNMAMENLKLSDFDNLELDTKITKILNELGISQKYDGFAYLRSAVKMCAMQEPLQHQIVKVVYRVIADAFGTTVSAVERCIRHYIKILWEKVDTELLCEFIPCVYYCNEKPPTNADVIATMSDNLRMGVYD